MLRRNKYKRYKYMGGYECDYIIHNEWMEEVDDSSSFQDEASWYAAVFGLAFAALAVTAAFNPISTMAGLSIWLFLSTMTATVTLGMIRIARDLK